MATSDSAFPTTADACQGIISNIINAPGGLFKVILSFSQVAVNSMDITTLNHVIQEVTKASGSVPFLGVGVASLGLIINTVAMAEDNKEKRQEIKRQAEFLLENLPELGEVETWQEELNKEILLLCKQACILQNEKTRREECLFRVWSCLGDVATARCKATTLDRVAVQLKSIRARFDTMLKIRTIHLIPKYSPLQAGDMQDVVGIESRKKEVLSFLEQPQPQGIHVVAIYGLGGIGKTTLLRVLREEIGNKKRHAMAYVELGEHVSIPALQQDIVLQLCGQSFKLRDAYEGRNRLLLCIRQIRDSRRGGLCLILDNVWEDGDLEELLPQKLREHLPPSSILLMSCRPKQQAEKFCRRICGADISSCKLYEPPFLSAQEAEKLFVLKAHAWGQEFQGTEIEIVKRIVPLCGGLPLALKVYGSYFNDKGRRTEDTWKNVERRLKEAEDSLEDKVFQRLQVSLDLQPLDLQQDFADVALFWKGKPWDDAKAALPDDNLLRLENQSLVAQDELDNTVKVHDLMVSLAKKYVKNQRASEYVVDSTLEAKGSQMDQLRGVSCTDIKVDMVDLAKMINLRFLILDNCRIQASLMQRTYLLDKYLPHIPHRVWLLLFLICLIVSTIIANISQVSYTSMSIIMVLGFTFLLIYLFSSHSLTPTFLCKDLAFLTLKDCVNTINLVGSIGNLRNLRSLNLSHNHGFTRFPSSIFSNLTSLRVLNLSSCFELMKLPSLGNMRSLKSLDVSSCIQLQELPKSLGDLRILENLDVSGCLRLASLPESLGTLEKLKVLKAKNCDALDRLPMSMDKLKSLQCLDLSCSDKLTRLPPTICGLVSLQVLDMSRCSRLKELPENLGNLRSLKKLILSHCESLVQLPTSLVNLACLKMLDLSFCDGLKELPTNINYLTSLETLDITACRKLYALPDLSSFLPHSPKTKVVGQPKSSTS